MITFYFASSPRNPFIPLDVSNPSLVQNNQSSLEGEGRQERKEVCDETGKLWGKMFRKEELNSGDFEMMEKYFQLLGEDIKTQRRRIGGDWVVAGCFPPSRIRDVLRSALTISDQY